MISIVRRQQAFEKMHPNEKKKTGPVSTTRIVRFLIGVVIFGVLMGMRPDFESRWTRALVAGIAAAILGLCALPTWRRKP